MTSKNIVGSAIIALHSMWKILENKHGIEIMKIGAHIIDKNVPKMIIWAQNFGYTQIKVGNPIPPSTTLTSIPTCTNIYVITTIQPTINANMSLCISTKNPFSFVY
jgi:hypothetical protein